MGGVRWQALLVLVAGFVLGCRSVPVNQEMGLQLAEVRRALPPLRFKKTPAYSDAMMGYFRYYGLEAAGSHSS